MTQSSSRVNVTLVRKSPHVKPNLNRKRKGGVRDRLYPNIITQVEVTSHIRNVSSIDYLLWFVMRFKVSAR